MRLSPQFDLLSVGAGEDDPSPAFFSRLSSGGVVRCAQQPHAIAVKRLNGLSETGGLQAKGETDHRTIRMMRQVQDRTAQF